MSDRPQINGHGGFSAFGRTSVIDSIVRENLRRDLVHTSVKVLAMSMEVTIILSWAGIRHGIGSTPSIVRLNFGIYVSILLLFAFAVSYLFVAVAWYSEVLEMAHELGILRMLGASMGYILGFLVQETLLITLLATIVGIVLTFGAKWFVSIVFLNYLTLDILYKWWLIGGAISAAGPLAGEAFALRKSVRQGMIHALETEE
jgi:ABC-type antimicrobial peptide transport system permease subunit